MRPRTSQFSNAELLTSFYRVFLVLGLFFLFIGVPFVFHRKTASALVCLAIIGMLAFVRWLSRRGQPELSLKIFAAFTWVTLVGLIFVGSPPITIATALAVSIMLCIVVSTRAGALFATSYMIAWFAYIVLGNWDLAPEPYFHDRPIVSWFIGVFTVWLVLLPVPALVRNMREAISLLKKSEERLALALDASGLSIWNFDIRAGRIQLDSQWANMIGEKPGVTVTTAAELTRRTHPDDLGKVVKAGQATLDDPKEHFQEEFRFKDARGEWKWIRCSGTVVERDANGQAVRAIGTNIDITEHKTAEEQIRQLAYYDTLTNLPNRRLLQDRLNQALSQAMRFKRSLAVMFLDLDHFKEINDRLGHDAGDELLKEVAARLTDCIRAGDTVSRQGGDEFVIVLAEIRDASDAPTVAEKIFQALETPVRLGDEEVIVTTSIGISVYPVNGTDHAQELLKKADSAMYAAKKAGRNRYCFFETREPCNE